MFYHISDLRGWAMGALPLFSTIFQLYCDSFISSGNWSTMRKPTAGRMQQILSTIFKFYCDNYLYDPILVVVTGIPGEHRRPTAGHKHFQQHNNYIVTV